LKCLQPIANHETSQNIQKIHEVLHFNNLDDLEDFEREALARKFGISTGVTQVKLHRALKQQHLAWNKQHVDAQKRESYECRGNPDTSS